MAICSVSSFFTLFCNTKPSSTTNPSTLSFCSLNFSKNICENGIIRGDHTYGAIKMAPRKSIVCEATSGKKPDSAEKRARQAEKRRIRNKSRKSEIKTRMKKVFDALDELKKKTEAQADEILPVEKLIAEAYSAIDKAVQKGTLHRNTGAHRKSRLARRKKAVEIHHAWYTPQPVDA
ncbi:30S ribosomal protein S20, chloroplastic [Amborella trichopoda]|nr:30S ribosomal protein S20, chloroplastic [Amborella trichopoda]|eukprot:XP_006859051.2 30S ribosomal protein S20, chloroplastic [Amborella trichopoda]